MVETAKVVNRLVSTTSFRFPITVPPLLSPLPASKATSTQKRGWSSPLETTEVTRFFYPPNISITSAITVPSAATLINANETRSPQRKTTTLSPLYYSPGEGRTEKKRVFRTDPPAFSFAFPLPHYIPSHLCGREAPFALR